MAIIFISFKVILIACSGILNFVSRIFIEGMYDVALAPTMITISGSIYIFNIFYKWLIFFYFWNYFFWEKSIIAICKFNELYCEVIIKAYCKIWFESCVTVASLVSTCAS